MLCYYTLFFWYLHYHSISRVRTKSLLMIHFSMVLHIVRFTYNEKLNEFGLKIYDA